MQRVIIIAAVLFLLFSCMGNRTIIFLKECQEDRTESGNQFYSTTASELKTQLPENDILYYKGSDEEFHYLKYHYRTWYKSYDKMNKWAVMNFKLPLDNQLPIQIEKYPINEEKPRRLKVSKLN